MFHKALTEANRLAEERATASLKTQEIATARFRGAAAELAFGAIFADATVEQICTPGYSASVRNVPISEKDQVYANYNIISHFSGQYEIDHLISLQLGGSNDIANLWPEIADPRPGFHEKDTVENYLHSQVCDGNIYFVIPLGDF